MSRTTRYPGYDVLAKRDTPSWDAPTRAVIDARLATPRAPRYLDAARWQTLLALCACIIPQHGEGGGEGCEPHEGPAPAVPVAALLDGKLLADRRDGFRDARLPPLREAWDTGLAALDAESEAALGEPFHRLGCADRLALIAHMQHGELRCAAWHGMPCGVFFAKRVLHDLSAAYWSHPAAWSELGFGGPANPRGYVRLYFNRRDPWEAVELHEAEQDDTAGNADEASKAHARAAVRRENQRVR
ncbi:gluconate 2-dehydrogenase subunit 3 family protein [Paraburkholderia sp. A1RI-2L]|uniref:gluconate 2-dehydrogenase subunit 3 family protein n=1 Tax=Paraburkholderia sp. A1RI-2L TaxID=3028367 RepID=UPI003B767581